MARSSAEVLFKNDYHSREERISISSGKFVLFLALFSFFHFVGGSFFEVCCFRLCLVHQRSTLLYFYITQRTKNYSNYQVEKCSFLIHFRKFFIYECGLNSVLLAQPPAFLVS